jgi:putative zincin peptidase
MQVFALPLGVLTALGVAVLWLMLTPTVNLIPSFPILGTLALCGGILVVHELIHAAVHPGFGLSAKTILGAWPSRGVFYAHYDGEITRERFLTVYLMPFAVISFGPLILCAAFRWESEWLAFVSWVNAFAACGDAFGTVLVLFQIPRGAIVRNQSWRTYWREPASLAPAKANRSKLPWALGAFGLCLAAVVLFSANRWAPFAARVVGHTNDALGFYWALAAVTNLTNADYEVRCIAEVFEGGRWDQAFMQNNWFDRGGTILAGKDRILHIPVPREAQRWRLKLVCYRQPGKLAMRLRWWLMRAGFRMEMNSSSPVIITVDMQ